jgi:SM-20-related protein
MLSVAAHKAPLHGLVSHWLGAETVDRLLAFAQSREHLFKDSDLGGKVRHVDRNLRISRKLKDLGELKNEIESKVQHLLPTMFETLGSRPFTVSFETELVAHGDGAFFTRHVDATKEGRESSRVISAVYYFHRSPKAFSGGALRIYSPNPNGDPGAFVDITPDSDTLVFFPSWSFHEVRPVTVPSGQFMDSRFAINCWVSRSKLAQTLFHLKHFRLVSAMSSLRVSRNEKNG